MAKSEPKSKSQDTAEVKPRGKRGPAPGTKPRAQIESDSTKARRERLLKSGLTEFKTFVQPSTKERLAELKTSMGKATVGDVLDAIFSGNEAVPGVVVPGQPSASDRAHD